VRFGTCERTTDDRREVIAEEGRTLVVEVSGVDATLRLPLGTVAEWTAVFQNVLTNSAAATQGCATREVVVSSRPDGQNRSVLVQDTGVDGFELNFSCPHGMTERKMGSEMGEHPDLTEEVTSWVTEVAKIPVWAKMTPNITNIREPAMAAVRGGAVGISAINTILSVIGVDLETLRPMPTVEGYAVPGGYSAQAVRPIALRMVSQLALGIPEGTTISGIGGIENSHDALEFFLLGSSTVQICTGVMLQGVKMVDELKEGVTKFMVDKGFNSVQEIVGKSLPYFSTHMELVQKMKAAKRSKAGEASRDNEWAQKDITEKTAELTSN